MQHFPTSHDRRSRRPRRTAQTAAHYAAGFMAPGRWPPIAQYRIERLASFRPLVRGAIFPPGLGLFCIINLRQRCSRSQSPAPNQTPHLFSCPPQNILSYMSQCQLQRSLALPQFIYRFKVCQVGRIYIAHFCDQGANLRTGMLGRAIGEERTDDGALEHVFDGKAQHFLGDHDLVIFHHVVGGGVPRQDWWSLGGRWLLRTTTPLSRVVAFADGCDALLIPPLL
mmetsp:Transcript_8990/g.19405  ORF Transcript_8990/g.19405 Transcript_8990/m.19405 type:complete len:225 (-) Transcript_8990:1318-1992(-)